MHERRAKTLSALILTLVVAAMAYVGVSYVETVNEVRAREQKNLVVQRQLRPKVSLDEGGKERYVAPAPITHPFF